jgi:hypothetical protein
VQASSPVCQLASQVHERVSPSSSCIPLWARVFVADSAIVGTEDDDKNAPERVSHAP